VDQPAYFEHVKERA